MLQHGCLFHQIAGQRERVRERAAELFELSEREGYPFWLAHARFFQRWAAVGERADVASVRRVADAREAVIATGSRLFYPYYSALLAELYGRIDEDDRALELLALALDTIETSQERWFEAEVHRLRGEHRARRAPDHLEPAIEDLREAMEVARRQGATLYELRAATTLAELLLGAGASDDAREALAPFSDWLGAQPPLPDVERARRAVEQLG